MSAFRGSGCPQSESAVQMDPVFGGMRHRRDLDRGIKSPGVYASRLNADNGWSGNPGQSASAHPPLTIDRHTDYPLATETQETQRFEGARVHLVAHYHRDGRRPK